MLLPSPKHGCHPDRNWKAPKGHLSHRIFKALQQIKKITLNQGNIAYKVHLLVLRMRPRHNWILRNLPKYMKCNYGRDNKLTISTSKGSCHKCWCCIREGIGIKTNLGWWMHHVSSSGVNSMISPCHSCLVQLIIYSVLLNLSFFVHFHHRRQRRDKQN